MNLELSTRNYPTDQLDAYYEEREKQLTNRVWILEIVKMGSFLPDRQKQSLAQQLSQGPYKSGFGYHKGVKILGRTKSLMRPRLLGCPWQAALGGSTTSTRFIRWTADQH